MRNFAIATQRVRRSIASVALLLPVTVSAQATVGPSPLRVSVTTGGLTPRSALIVDALGSGDTRLGSAPAFGAELQYQALGKVAVYGGGLIAFGTLHHGTSMGVNVRGSTSDAVIFAGTGGIMLDWFSGAVRPLVRLGGGLKGYSFSTEGSEGFITPTGDFGLGFRAGTSSLELGAEVRYLPSVFDQGKLPTRGIVAQDQRQTDLFFGIFVTVRP